MNFVDADDANLGQPWHIVFLTQKWATPSGWMRNFPFISLSHSFHYLLDIVLGGTMGPSSFCAVWGSFRFALILSRSRDGFRCTQRFIDPRKCDWTFGAINFFLVDHSRSRREGVAKPLPSMTSANWTNAYQLLGLFFSPSSVFFVLSRTLMRSLKNTSRPRMTRVARVINPCARSLRESAWLVGKIANLESSPGYTSRSPHRRVTGRMCANPLNIFIDKSTTFTSSLNHALRVCCCLSRSNIENEKKTQQQAQPERRVYVGN